MPFSPNFTAAASIDPTSVPVQFPSVLPASTMLPSAVTAAVRILSVCSVPSYAICRVPFTNTNIEQKANSRGKTRREHNVKPSKSKNYRKSIAEIFAQFSVKGVPHLCAGRDIAVPCGCLTTRWYTVSTLWQVIFINHTPRYVCSLEY